MSVALQLPDSETIETPNNRLTDKFPSSTTLWLILRKFESGAAGGLGRTRNFTARGIPRGGEGGTGSGRLYHESPVLLVMGRELASFTDLQKTLGQLGFNSGTALLRLSFRASETPLEEAMEQIGQYFASIEEGDKATETNINSIVNQSSPQKSTSEQSIPESRVATESNTQPATESDTQPATEAAPTVEQVVTSENPTPNLIPSTDTITQGPGQRAISVFAPPSSSAPSAARQAFNEEDYEPTIEQARLHQARLNQSSRNKRLPTDAEVAAQQEAQRQKLANVKEVEIKIRFPDQRQVVSKFSDADTGSNLYSFVKDLLERENEPFILNFSSARGPKTVPNDAEIKLVSGLAMTGKVLVNFLWDEGASVEARGGPVLKDKYQSQAREIQNPEIKKLPDRKENQSQSSALGLDSSLQNAGEGKGKGTVKVPKWLKLPGKK